MKKQMITLILISMVLGSPAQIFATDDALKENAIQDIEEVGIKSIKLAEDVFIEGLYEGAVLYVGADIRIKGAVDKQATQKNITWQITGNNGIIDFKESGNNAQITGRSMGTVWVMARAMDGSDRAREYTVNVKNYPTDSTSQSLISGQITPILRRPFQNSGSILQVEVSKSLASVAERESALKAYIKKLASRGVVSNQDVYSDEYYEYYVIGVGNSKIEVRLSKNDISYLALKKILMNVGEYAQGTVEEVQKPSTEKVPNPPSQEKPKQPTEENKPSAGNEVTQGTDNIIILGGSGTSVEDPLIVTLKESLTSQEKVAQMKAYLEEIGGGKRLGLVRKRDDIEFTSYTLKVSERNGSKEETKNDFFIDIRVKKEDKESYIPIIEMLEDIEKETLQGVGDKNITEEKKESNKTSNSNNQEKLSIEDTTKRDFSQKNIIEEGVVQENSSQVSTSKENDPQEGAAKESNLLGSSFEENTLIKVPLQQSFYKKDPFEERSVKEDEKGGIRFNSIIVCLSLGVVFLIKNSL